MPSDISWIITLELQAASCRQAPGASVPDILDAPRIVTDEPVAEGLEGAGHRLGMAFEAGLAQPNVPSSASTRTNSQRGGTWKVSIRSIFMTCLRRGFSAFSGIYIIKRD
jgi:hypothetical protein